MRWNQREIVVEERERALFNENQLDMFTHKPNCRREPYEMFEKKKRIRKLCTSTYLLCFLKLFSLIPPLFKHIICCMSEMQLFQIISQQKMCNECGLVSFLIDQLKVLS